MKFFTLENPLWANIGKILDVIVLHFLWLVCSLPIFTLGASTTALYYALMKDTSDEDNKFIRAFFRSFKMNLKPAMGLGLIALLAYGGLGFSAYFCGLNIETLGFFGEVVRVLCLILIVLFTALFAYAFPLMARFDNTTFRTLKNSFLFSIRHFGWTILMLIIFFGWFALVYFLRAYILPLLFVFGISIVVFADSFIMNHVLAPYIIEQQKKDGTYVEEIGDEWTLADDAVFRESTEKKE